MPKPKDWAEDWKLQFIERIAQDGRTLRSVVSDKDIPSAVYVYDEMERDPDFAKQYARAANERADAIFEEILEIADDSANDYMDRKRQDGSVDHDSLNAENIQRSRLRVDARKWMLGKMRPKKYGDKLDLNHSGSFNVTIGADDADCL